MIALESCQESSKSFWQLCHSSPSSSFSFPPAYLVVVVSTSVYVETSESGMNFP